ncbi:Zinc finger BED domain-containing protein DAYSLEEPER, partial [Bienertia sinuspersici]
YWSKDNVVISCVTILYPRLKVKFVEYCFVKLFGVDDAMIQVGKLKVLTTLKFLYNEYKLQSSTSPTVSPCPLSNGLEHFFHDYNNYILRKLAFSLGGKTISRTRSSLKPKTVQALVRLQDWCCDEHGIFVDIEREASSCDESLNEDEDDENNHI